MVRNSLKNYQEMLTAQQSQVERWSTQETRSTHMLLESLKSSLQGSENLEHRGRIEYLEQRVKVLDECVIKEFKECFKQVNDRIQEEIYPLKDRLETIDPGLVGKSRFGKSGWNPFAWIVNVFSSWWNRDTIVGLQNRCSLLEENLRKPIPSTEEEYTQWMGENHQAELKQNFSMKASNHLTANDTLAKVVTENLKPKSLLIAQYEKLKRNHPDLKYQNGENYDEDEKGLTVSGSDFRVFIGNNLALSEFERNFMMCAHLSRAPIENWEFVTNNLFSQDIQAFIKWRTKQEIVYHTSQVGTVEVGDVGPSGNKDFEHSKFVTRNRIAYTLNTSTGEIEFEGDGIRLGLSLKDFSKPLERLKDNFPGMFRVINTTLNWKYSEGVKITLNLKKIGQVFEDNKWKISAKYALNESNPIPLARGKDIVSILKQPLMQDGVDLNIEINEFKDTFRNIQWTSEA